MTSNLFHHAWTLINSSHLTTQDFYHSKIIPIKNIFVFNIQTLIKPKYCVYVCVRETVCVRVMLWSLHYYHLQICSENHLILCCQTPSLLIHVYGVHELVCSKDSWCQYFELFCFVALCKKKIKIAFCSQSLLYGKLVMCKQSKSI